MKILTVDDSGIMRKMIKGAISRLGYEALEAEDGEKAMATLAISYRDLVLVLLDWNMPNKDGYQTLLEIKADARYSHIPVVMVTTEGEKANIIKAIQAGANNYVVKPFQPEDLLTKMMETMGMGLD